jgi:hypothetical protein
MEFPNDRNTSAESIIATKETFVRFMDTFCAGNISVEREEEREETKRVVHHVLDTIFDTDNVDMYESVYIGIFSKSEETDDDESFIRSVWPVIRHNSIQIMKHIISNEETLSKMKQIDAPEEDEDADPVKLASCVTSACNVEMIEYLRGKGVEFNARSVYFALKGRRMDTLRHLLDFVPCDVEEMHSPDLWKIAGSACESEGYEGLRVLKEKGWLRGPILYILFECVTARDLPVDAIKIFINEQSEKSEIEYLFGIGLKYQRLDIVKYLHPSLLYLDVERTIASALENGGDEFAEFLRPLL